VKLSEKFFEYDDQGPELVSEGNLTAVRTRINDTAEVVSTMSYDDYGNVKEVIDERGYMTQSTFDETTHWLYSTVDRRPSTPAIGGIPHIVQREVDLRYGKETKLVDENGQIFERRYDSLGRVLVETRPGDTPPDQPCPGSAFCRAAAYIYSYPAATAATFEDHLTQVEVRRREPNRAPGGAEYV